MKEDVVKRWVEIAAEGMNRLETAAEHGSTMARRAQVAEDLGVSRQSLRNYMDCLRFVHQVDAIRPEAGTALRGFAATVVAVYSRWYRYDPVGALDHAIAAKGMPATRIIAAEKVARRSLVTVEPTLLERAMENAKGLAGKAISKALARSVEIDAPLRIEELQIVPNVDALSIAMGAAKALSTADGRLTMPVIELDRGSVGDGHRRGARSALSRATLAAVRHPLIVVLLPDPAAIKEYISFLPSIDEYVVFADSPMIHVFANGLGAVATMSVERFAQEWSAD